jgi:oxaloacetate decarboxylase beta subunit
MDPSTADPTQATSKLEQLWSLTAISDVTWQMMVMWVIIGVLFYLAVYRKFEPLLLVPIAFGALLANLPTEGLINPPEGGHGGGLYYYISLGVELEIFPPLIFLGVGALTDFGPLIANPRTLLLGAAAQFGVFATFLGAVLIGFSPQEAGAIGIIGGADGPTSIFLANKMAPHLLAPIAVAAYSYMALVPMIQPPIMRALTTKNERKIRMNQLRPVGKVEKIVFPIVVLGLCILLLPSAAPLIGFFMFGNLMRECGVVERLSQTAQNAMINIVTILLGLGVGAQLSAGQFLNLSTLGILVLGSVAFAIGTASGVLMVKLMNLFLTTKINPLIGSAGVSAVPMAARVSQKLGMEADPQNHLLMHAMGPNVAGVIGSAVTAGVLLTLQSLVI